MFDEKSVLKKLRKTQIKFKKFIKGTPKSEVSELLLLHICLISLVIFTIGLCSIPILPVLCNTYPTLGVKFFHILFEKIIYPSGGVALVTLAIYYIFFAEGE